MSNSSVTFGRRGGLSRRRAFGGLVFAIAIVLLSRMSAAQEDAGGAPDPWAGVEEMVVTSGNVSALLVAETTSAISFDSEMIQTERIGNVADLSSFTPNLEIKSAFAASNPVLFVRGVGLDDFNANSASAVAIYQDGVYMNSPAGQLFQLFDTQAVDVLRGPQSGRYRNASAAAIRVETKKPSPEFDAYTNFTTGNYGLVETEGALNIPMVEDALFLRLSGKQSQRNGFTKNRCDGKTLLRFNDPNFGDRDCARVFAEGFSLGEGTRIPSKENNAENWAARGQLLWQVPMDDGSMEWLLNVHGGQNKSRAAQFQHRGFPRSGPLPTDPRVPGFDVTGYADTDSDPFAGDFNNGGDEALDLVGASLHGTWELSDLHTLFSLSAYEYHKRETLENTDANPRNLLTTEYQDEAWQFSQDLRLESNWADGFDTTIGAYLIVEDLDVNNASELRTQFILDLEYTQLTRSGAVYGELEWELFPGVTFSATTRYTHEYKSFDNFSDAINVSGVSGIGLNTGKANTTFTGLSGHAAIDWEFLDDYSLYAKFTRGWKPGHFNGGSVFSAQLIEPVKPEEIFAYEVGGKAELFEGAVSISGAVFYYDYTNLHTFALEQDSASVPLPQLINAEGAEIFGAEAELSIEPIENLVIRYNAGFLLTEYTKFTNSIFETPISVGGEPPDPVEVVLDYTGNEMVGAPRWSMSGSIQYTIETSKLGRIIPRVSFSWKDDTFFDVAEGKGFKQDLPDDTIGQSAHGFLNASLAWHAPEDQIFVRGWAKNLTNTEARVQSFDVTRGFDFVFDAYAAPRTFGVTMGFKL